MQKEIIVVIIVFSIMGIFYYVSQKYINTKINFVVASIQEVADLLDKDYKNKDNININYINEKLEEINHEWEEVSKKLAIYITHTELDNLTASIKILSKYTSMENYTDAIPFASKCIVQLKQLLDKEDLSIINLF